MIWLVLVGIVCWLSILTFRYYRLEVSIDYLARDQHTPAIPLRKRCSVIFGGERCYLVEGHETDCAFSRDFEP